MKVNTAEIIEVSEKHLGPNTLGPRLTLKELKVSFKMIALLFLKIHLPDSSLIALKMYVFVLSV